MKTSHCFKMYSVCFLKEKCSYREYIHTHNLGIAFSKDDIIKDSNDISIVFAST